MSKHTLSRIEEEDIKRKLRTSERSVIPAIAKAFAPQGVTADMLELWWWEMRNGTVPFLPEAFERRVA